MLQFELNGQPAAAGEDQNLLAFLRAQGCISVKNGCGTGACGACTILVDGAKRRACLLTVGKVAGKSVTTLEGLAPFEQEVYAYAFGKAGAVQCGFCIPGMVMSAKALLDATPRPNRQQVSAAIKGNLCRCTGYKKIEQAILLAGELFEVGALPAEETPKDGVGTPMVRVDARDKVLAKARYCDDVSKPGQLYGAVLRAQYPRALVESIDTAAAEHLPGGACVLTAAHIPGNVYDGYLLPDWPVLVPVGEETRCVGDAIAIAAADTPERARQACEAIKVHYRELPPLTSPAAALAEGARALHPGGNLLAERQVERGDAEAVLAASHCTVTGTFSTPFGEHAFLEPESALAYFEGEMLHLHVATQNIHHDAHCLSNILGVPAENIRVRAQYIGGAFGGKEDLSVQHYAALLAQRTGKPVKITLSREESMRVHPKRHPMQFSLTLGADAEGRFTALKAQLVADTGAYASLGPGVMERAVTHLCGPYRFAAVSLQGKCVYTNNPPAGAFRGFGVAQSAFALETAIDMLAAKLGIDRFDIRLRNALREGDAMGPGQRCTPDTAMHETLRAVEGRYRESLAAGKTVGIACALKNSGVGVGLPDVGRATLKVEEGRVVLYSAALCIGQGLATVMIQIVAETCGIPVSKIHFPPPDTLYTEDTGATTGSRQTVISGEAVRRAALQLKAALAHAPLEELSGRSYHGEYAPKTDPLNAPGVATPRNHVAYSYATNLVVLGEDGRIEQIVAAFDVGRAINPLNVEGQIEGGVVMGMGYALTEDLRVENGRIGATFAQLGLLRAPDVPPIECIILGKGTAAESYAAKGIGEISTIPIAPAIASAYNARAGTFQTRLPLRGTPYKR